jgi:hypothetical protein
MREKKSMSEKKNIPPKTAKKTSSKAAKGKEEVLFFAPALEQFLGRLPLRSRDIIAARFGMHGKDLQTLEEIGRAYNITRERVRQVIGSALGSLAQESEHPTFVQISLRIQSTLKEKSGIIHAEEFLTKLAPMGGKERGSLLAFVECLSIVEEQKAVKEREKIYVLKDFSLVEWAKVKDSAKTILAEANQALDQEGLFDRYTEKHDTISRQELFDFLSVAKDVCQNVFGKWGLAGWSDIKPRGTREKAHLVLKMAGKPLHFREITTLIDSYGLHSSKKRKSHPQTVHNELIKDKRFVLVGRGIYALSDWGYKKGTVKEVIGEILTRMKKPLSREEVLAEVLKIRQVKRSTVIINLNTFFHRVGKNAYTVKK